jgi:hypothetical protein
VFHRGVGVATAPGLYLPQKLDLLIDYTVVQPVADLMQGLARAVTGTAQQLQQQASQLLQRSPQQHQQHGVQKDQPDAQQQQQQQRSASRQYSLASTASSDVEHPAARVVVRRSLRSLMPGPGHVLRRFWEPLLLQVRRGWGGLMSHVWSGVLGLCGGVWLCTNLSVRCAGFLVQMQNNCATAGSGYPASVPTPCTPHARTGAKPQVQVDEPLSLCMSETQLHCVTMTST